MCRLIRCPLGGFEAAFCLCKHVHNDTQSIRARGVKCRMRTFSHKLTFSCLSCCVCAPCDDDVFCASCGDCVVIQLAD